MYNKVILIGRLTRDPDVRNSENGNRVSFTLAVDRHGIVNGEVVDEEKFNRSPLSGADLKESKTIK